MTDETDDTFEHISQPAARVVERAERAYRLRNQLSRAACRALQDYMERECLSGDMENYVNPTIRVRDKRKTRIEASKKAWRSRKKRMLALNGGLQ